MTCSATTAISRGLRSSSTRSTSAARNRRGWWISSIRATAPTPAPCGCPGECFEDVANEILICVESVTTEGYTVRVGYGDWYFLFDDDFESGGTSAWNAMVN